MREGLGSRMCAQQLFESLSFECHMMPGRTEHTCMEPSPRKAAEKRAAADAAADAPPPRALVPSAASPPSLTDDAKLKARARQRKQHLAATAMLHPDCEAARAAFLQLHQRG